MSELTRDDFAKHLNTKFRVPTSDGQTLELELTEVTELRQSPRTESFSMIFRAPGDAAPDQRLYQMEHDELGALDIFLVPVGHDKKGLWFEALFNRVVNAEDD
jgi:hypothetical protein